MLILGLYMFTVHMCSLLITFKASVPICGWPQSDSSPFKVAPGRGSDVTTTSADWSRLPGPAVHPVSVASLLPRATTEATQENGDPQVWAVENNKDQWGVDDSRDNNSVGHRG